MNKNRLIQLLLFVLAAAALAGAAGFHAPLQQIRTEMDLESGEDLTESHANIKLIQAMPGVLRVLLIDYLWIQSEEMKQQGNFYDAEQKTAMICALQPRFPQVWGNRAWNLAYNISVQSYTPWERWRWVSSGIELLRDKGLVYNPKSLYLYMELAQTYFQKLGQLTDTMHRAYWSFHAAEFHRVLGAPPRQSDIKYYRDWMAKIADAPESLEALRANADAAAFLDALVEVNLKANLELLDAYNTYSDDSLVKMIDQPLPPDKTERDKALRTLMTDSEFADGRDAVIAYTRSKVLRETYKMKPDWMLHLLTQYGPMDWRLVWTHSLYWASYGIEHCKNQDIRYDKLATSRFMLFSLRFLMSYNRATLLFNAQHPEQPFVEMQSDWRMIDACNEAYKQLGALVDGADSEHIQKEGTAYTFMVGHENFLKLSIQTLYCAGRVKEAEDYYAYAKSQYSWKNERLYSLPMERFVFETLNDNGISNRQMMANFVNGFIENAYRSIAYGYDADFSLSMDRAKMFWRLWNEAAQNDPRKVLEPLNIIQSRVALDTLQRVPLESAMSIWEYVPLDAQRASYDQLIIAYRDKCKQLGIDINKAFPEPPGMEAYRKERARITEEMNRRSGEKPEE